MEYVSLDSVQSANANQQGQIVKQEFRQKVMLKSSTKGLQKAE